MFFVCNKRTAKFLCRSNHVGRYRKELCYHTDTKHDCTSAIYIYIFKWNAPLSVTNKGWSPFPSANHWQGQLETPQSVSVDLTLVLCVWIIQFLKISVHFAVSFTWIFEWYVQKSQWIKVNLRHHIFSRNRMSIFGDWPEWNEQQFRFGHRLSLSPQSAKCDSY